MQTDTVEHVRVAIDNLWRSNGRAPTLREIGAAINRSPASVSNALRTLAARGDVTLTVTRSGRKLSAMRGIPTEIERLVTTLHKHGMLCCNVEIALTALSTCAEFDRLHT